MAKADLLSLAEFATRAGTTRGRVLRRLQGQNGAQWRELLRAVKTKQGFLFPIESVDIWLGAGSASYARDSAKLAQGAASARATRGQSVSINSALMQLPRRAETIERSVLRETFVDVGPLRHLITSPNHQVIFGRRGTGKTHALSFLADYVQDEGEVAIQVDLRKAGSTGMYANSTIPVHARGTQLLIETLSFVHSRLLDIGLADDSTELITSQLLPRLDVLGESLSTVEVIGSVEVEDFDHTDQSTGRKGGATVRVSSDRLPGIDLSREATRSHSTVFERRIKASGTPNVEVNFGAVTQALERVVESLDTRLWILIDEWSSLPIELQPILAEFVRRALLPVQGLVVKIAAREDVSHFRIPTSDRDYLGLELGADVTADINLDDFMVFGNQEPRAIDFFATLLMKHVASAVALHGIENPDEFISSAFRDRNVFREYVRAAEGVPRDAINIAALAATKADTARIGSEELRDAAREWYQRDKEGAVKRPEARALLSLIIDEVVGKRKKRVFLLARGSGGSEDYIIRELYDARLLHILRRGMASAERPSQRFDGFAVDYGCYVDLMTIDRGRESSLAWFEDVPPDRFAAVQRDILDLTKLRGMDVNAGDGRL